MDYLDSSTKRFSALVAATCHCGAISYEVGAEPVDAKICHYLHVALIGAARNDDVQGISGHGALDTGVLDQVKNPGLIVAGSIVKTAVTEALLVPIYHLDRAVHAHIEEAIVFDRGPAVVVVVGIVFRP